MIAQTFKAFPIAFPIVCAQQWTSGGSDTLLKSTDLKIDISISMLQWIIYFFG